MIDDANLFTDASKAWFAGNVFNISNKKLRKRTVRLIPALEFLLQLHRGTVANYDSVDVAQAWKAVEDFIKQMKIATTE